MKSRLLVALYTIIITQCFAVSETFAGFILLSGDTNIGNAMDTDFLPINANNGTWFTNILGSGTTVKILDEGSQSSAVDSVVAINDHYNTLGGVSSTLACSEHDY